MTSKKELEKRINYLSQEVVDLHHRIDRLDVELCDDMDELDMELQGQIDANKQSAKDRHKELKKHTGTMFQLIEDNFGFLGYRCDDLTLFEKVEAIINHLGIKIEKVYEEETIKVSEKTKEKKAKK